jgi:hypothetical protein
VAVDGFGSRGAALQSPEAPKLISAGRVAVAQTEPAGVTVVSATKPTAATPTIAPPTDGWFGERIWVDTDATDGIIDLQ